MGGCQVLGPSRPLLGLRGGCGARLLKICITTMNTKNSTSSAPRQQNKRLCPGSDDSDTDTNTTSVFPRWLVIEAAEPDHSLSKLSPFALGKALQAQIGTLKTIKRLQRGDILVETEKKLQQNVARAYPTGGSASQGQPQQITEHEQRRDTLSRHSRLQRRGDSARTPAPGSNRCFDYTCERWR